MSHFSILLWWLTINKILVELGTGLSVIDNKNEIPTVGSLINNKRGKRKRKGTPATSPLKVVGMDIGYGESNLVVTNMC